MIIEGNDSTIVKVWYIKLKSLDGTREKHIHPFRMTVQEVYDEFMEWVGSFPDGSLVVGHNILGYDQWTIWKMFDIVPRFGKGGSDWIEDKKVQFVDTYYLSMYLTPDLPSHSLEYLAKGVVLRRCPIVIG